MQTDHWRELGAPKTKVELNWELIGVPTCQQFCFDLIFSSHALSTRLYFCLETVMTRPKPTQGTQELFVWLQTVSFFARQMPKILPANTKDKTRYILGRLVVIVWKIQFHIHKSQASSQTSNPYYNVEHR